LTKLISYFKIDINIVMNKIYVRQQAKMLLIHNSILR